MIDTQSFVLIVFKFMAIRPWLHRGSENTRTHKCAVIPGKELQDNNSALSHTDNWKKLVFVVKNSKKKNSTVGSCECVLAPPQGSDV